MFLLYLHELRSTSHHGILDFSGTILINILEITCIRPEKQKVWRNTFEGMFSEEDCGPSIITLSSGLEIFVIESVEYIYKLLNNS